jgi:hypothetical protein
VRWGGEDSLLSVLLGVLGGDPGEAPLEVGEHVLHGLGPLLLAVELHLDGVGVPGAGVLHLTLLHLVGQAEPGVPLLHLLLKKSSPSVKDRIAVS